MGLFGTMFEKKSCNICEKETGRFFGNNKLEDGNMCDECAAKLSPFFPRSSYRKTTVELINKQLGYRRKNKKLLSEFKATRVIGGKGMRLLIDDNLKKFVALPNSESIGEYNPDLIPFNLILGFRMEAEEDEIKDEIYRTNSKGERVSYNPPRYDISYSSNVYVYIDVRKKYFKQMKLQVNENTISSSSRNCPEFVSCKKIAQEMIDFLKEAQDQVREQAAAESEPKQAVTCPWCGATTFPDDNGCCEYCGGAIKG